jgi:hypothetical protein
VSPRPHGPVSVDVFPAEVAVIPPPALGVTTDELILSLPTLSSRVAPGSLPLGSQRLSRVRLVVANGAVFVFADSTATPGAQDRVLALALTGPPTGFANAQSTSEGRATTSDGTLVTWSRGHGCGCGSRLRSFNPYRDERTLTL